MTTGTAWSAGWGAGSGSGSAPQPASRAVAVSASTPARSRAPPGGRRVVRRFRLTAAPPRDGCRVRSRRPWSPPCARLPARRSVRCSRWRAASAPRVDRRPWRAGRRSSTRARPTAASRSRIPSAISGVLHGVVTSTGQVRRSCWGTLVPSPAATSRNRPGRSSQVKVTSSSPDSLSSHITEPAGSGTVGSPSATSVLSVSASERPVTVVWPAAPTQACASCSRIRARCRGPSPVRVAVTGPARISITPGAVRATGPSDRSAVAVAVSAGSHTVRIPMPTTSAATPSSATRATRARRTSTRSVSFSSTPGVQQPFHHRRDPGQTPIGADPRRGGNQRGRGRRHTRTNRPARPVRAARRSHGRHPRPRSPDPSGRRSPRHAQDHRAAARSRPGRRRGRPDRGDGRRRHRRVRTDRSPRGRGRAALLRRLRRPAHLVRRRAASPRRAVRPGRRFGYAMDSAGGRRARRERGRRSAGVRRRGGQRRHGHQPAGGGRRRAGRDEDVRRTPVHDRRRPARRPRRHRRGAARSSARWRCRRSRPRSAGGVAGRASSRCPTRVPPSPGVPSCCSTATASCCCPRRGSRRAGAGGQGRSGATEDLSIWPGPVGSPTTTTTVVDVSDPGSPRLVSQQEVEGTLVGARLSGGVVRVVTTSTPDAGPARRPAGAAGRQPGRRLGGRGDRGEPARAGADERRAVPARADHPGRRRRGRRPRRPAVACSEVAHPTTDAGAGMLTVRSLDLTSGSDPVVDRTAVATDGELVYASADRLYVATTRGGWSFWTGLRGDVPQIEDPTTELHGFATDDGSATTYLASGEVDGVLLGRWAMSARDGRLRVATTVGQLWAGGRPAAAVGELRDRARGAGRRPGAGGPGRRARQGRDDPRGALVRRRRDRGDLPADRPAVRRGPVRPGRARP